MYPYQELTVWVFDLSHYDFRSECETSLRMSERESERQVHHGDTPSAILKRKRERVREWRGEGDRKEGPKSRVLCLDLVYGSSLKVP